MSKLVKKKSTAPKKVVQAKPKKVKATKVSKKEKDVNKPKNKKRKNRHWFLAGILTLFILIASGALAFCIYIITSAPKFEVEKLYKSSSSILYDSEMNVIAELGLEIRENVTYDELSEVLVDAIVATEDSKFFQHNGIDLLRFSKAVLGQLMGQSDAGGGSTLTMQIVKNTYNGTASHGIKGIIRKFTDIFRTVFCFLRLLHNSQRNLFHRMQNTGHGNIYICRSMGNRVGYIIHFLSHILGVTNQIPDFRHRLCKTSCQLRKFVLTFCLKFRC